MFVENKYIKFYEKNKYIPKMFNPYNCQEIIDLSPTMTTQCGSTTSSAAVLILESEEDMSKIIKYNMPITVKVRKHKCDIEELKAVLRNGKSQSKLTNKEIALALKKPLTLVEHWFRKDGCFSIPDEDIWFELKELLKISTDEFDSFVTEFEYRDGVFDKSNRFYDSDGISPTLTSASAENEKFIVSELLEDTQYNNLKNNNSRGEIMNRELINFKEILGHDELLVAEFFKGYGSQSMSLDAIGVPNKVVVGSEIDVDAIISYASVRHSQEELNKKIDLTDDEIKKWLMDRNIGWDFQKKKSSIPRMKKDKLYKLYNACILDNEVGDISLVNPNELPDFDLMTYSFPCTDISVAGIQQGLAKGSGTRSGLLWECEKIISVKKPKYLLMENVKNLVGKQFKHEFDKWCEWLEEQGYTNYWQVMNAKDYGVPQNRERVFMVSILGEHIAYNFPQKQELKIRLKDVLEDKVDQKYYIDNEASNKLIQALKEKGFRDDITGIANNPRSREYNDFKEVSPTLCARDYKDPKIVIQQNENDINPNRLGNIYGEQFGTGYGGNVWDKETISPTLTTMQGGRREPMIIDDTQGFDGVRTYDDMTPTLRSQRSGLKTFDKTYKIRKLTPRECFRLMGVNDEIFDRIQSSGISNSQLYKQAGNSIVRDCLDEIFIKLFFKEENF